MTGSGEGSGASTGPAPTRTVRWGFLGAGSIARTALAPAVHAAAGAVLQSVAARDPARAQALGPVTVAASYEALLDDPEVDAVYISLPNDAHLPWSRAALEAGKHVLCEKPLCLTAEQVDKLRATAARTGRTAVEASWYRWHPRVRLAQARLPEIGPVVHVDAAFAFRGVPDGDYRLDPAKGGGGLYDVGCYAVSACLWAVGQGLPSAVAARCRTGGLGVDLEAQVVLDWDGSGASAQVQCGIEADEVQRLVITGEHGEIELRGSAYAPRRGAATELWVSDGSGTERVPVPAVDAYQVMVEEVSSHLTGGPGWVLPLEQSRQTAAVLDAAFASCAAQGAPVPPGASPQRAAFGD